MNSTPKKGVIIVGGLGLIGRAIVEKVRSAGLKPVIVDVREPDRSSVQGEVFFKADLSQKEAETSLFEKLQPFQSQILGWVNVAYPKTSVYGTYDYLDDLTDDGIENLTLHGGTFYRSCRLAVRIFQKNGGGSIVNFGSIYGPMGPDMRIYEGTKMHNAASYAMVKEAVIGLTRYVATTFADSKIRCNAVCPGGIYDGQDPSFVTRYSNRVPLGRMATPEEVASAAVFLISEESSYITGQALMVDGGLSSW